jgi:uncharacterized protein (TIGR02678 family)
VSPVRESPLAGGSGEGEERLRAERQQAARLLLASPFLADDGADPQLFALVRRHGRWLQTWFAEQLGYRLVLDTELARLHKRPAPGARLRPLRTRSGAPFSPRHYALGCLVLAALERMEVQTTLSDLAAQARVLAGSEEGVRDFDLDRYAERLAFVEAVRWLVDLGVLRLADGDEASFVEGRGDALYDVHGRRLTQLLAASIPPALAAEPEDLAAETYPATDEGANRRLRHRLMRRLVEEPVLYFADLEPAELAYVTSQRHYLLRQVAEATGMTVEVRREGLAAVDPEERLSDLAFPSSGTVSHAALLLAEYLAARARPGGHGGDGSEAGVAVPFGELASVLADLITRYGRFWSQRYREEPGRLLAEALERLERMGLVELEPEGVVPRPAVARLRPEELRVASGDPETDDV